LRGGPGGKLAVVPGQQSGLVAYGEQRGLATADFNRDGRIDLVLGQNGGETKLWENRSAKPGVRLRLVGSPSNPDALGAFIRIEGTGAFEIRSGAGYWSQDSLTKVLPSGARGIQIRWPGGKTARHTIPAGAKEVTIHQSGEVNAR
jgi:hypothetical protein